MEKKRDNNEILLILKDENDVLIFTTHNGFFDMGYTEDEKQLRRILDSAGICGICYEQEDDEDVGLNMCNTCSKEICNDCYEKIEGDFRIDLFDGKIIKKCPYCNDWFHN